MGVDPNQGASTSAARARAMVAASSSSSSRASRPANQSRGRKRKIQAHASEDDQEHELDPEQPAAKPKRQKAKKDLAEEKRLRKYVCKIAPHPSHRSTTYVQCF